MALKVAPKWHSRKIAKQNCDMIKENSQISTSEMVTTLGVGVRSVMRRIKRMTNICICRKRLQQSLED